MNVYDFTLWTIVEDSHFSAGMNHLRPNFVRSFALAGEVAYQWQDTAEKWRALNQQYTGSAGGSQGFEDYQVRARPGRRTSDLEHLNIEQI